MTIQWPLPWQIGDSGILLLVSSLVNQHMQTFLLIYLNQIFREP
jgi:hypothetical protein